MPTPQEYQALIKDGCPRCGESLVIRTGKYGEFLACSEWCGYKKSIPGRSEYPPPKVIKHPCPYNKCDGSGLIQFKKNGKVIPYCWSHCDCHPVYGLNPKPEHYRDVQLEDYDFPCSSTFRAYSHQYCGVADPGSDASQSVYNRNLEEEKPQVIEHIHRHGDMSKQEFDLLQQTARKATYLEKKLNELSKPKQKPQHKQTGYKGLAIP